MPGDHPNPDLLYRRFAPLRLVAYRLRSSPVPADTFFDPDDFMLMNWCRADRPSEISLFKHVDTRHYLNLDQAGDAYRYVPLDHADGDGPGRYVPHRSLREALLDLGLWQLPWMRPEFRDHQHGSDWDDRWDRYEELNGISEEAAS